MIEGKVIPVALFLVALEVTGMTGALVAALAWSLATIAFRRSMGRPIPGLVVLGAIGLTVNTVLAVTTGSETMYFLQPVIVTAMVGLAFLVSVPLGRPLAHKLANDFCPLDAQTQSLPIVRLFFVRLSLLFAFTSLLNAAVTLWLFLTQPITTFMIVKSVLGPSLTVATVAVAVLCFWRRLQGEGLQLAFSPSMSRAN